MGFYHLDLDTLSNHTNISVEELKNKSYAKLEAMIEDMNHAKFMEQNNKNAEDKEYERLILKFFEPVAFLRHWFDEKEIVLACANTGVNIGDICDKQFTEPGTGKLFYEKYGEYLRTSVEYVPQYDRYGRELMARGQKRVDVYRVKSQYQGHYHGKVIEHLLYGRYPELAKFSFKFYEHHSYEHDYEIYPAGNIYVPFTALMSGDIDSIIYRNREYCKSYNHGHHTPENCEKMLRTKEVLEMFDMIRSVGEREREAGHRPFTTDEDGKLIMSNGMKEIGVSESGNVKLLRYRDDTGRKSFKLKYAAPCTVEYLLGEFLSMVGNSAVNMHVCHITDYLMAHAIHISKPKKDTDDASMYPNRMITMEAFKGHGNAIDQMVGYTVHNVFGCIHENSYDLTIRIDCPDLMEK